jgi:hypothetical protein
MKNNIQEWEHLKYTHENWDVCVLRVDLNHSFELYKLLHMSELLLTTFNIHNYNIKILKKISKLQNYKITFPLTNYLQSYEILLTVNIYIKSDWFGISRVLKRT